MKKSILFGLILMTVQLHAQDDSVMVRKIVNETLVNGTAYENLRILCKQAGPRVSGSAAFNKAVQLAHGMMKNIGADTVYLQECMIPHWVRGEKEKGRLLLPGGKKYDLKLCALGNSVGTGAKGVTGEIVEVKTMDELHKLGTAGVKGKIVFFNFKMNPTHIRVFTAYGESGTGRNRGPAQAAKYGAIGVMVRSLAINLNDFPHTGATTYNDSFPKIPAVAISTNDAEYLSKQLALNSSVKGYFRTMCQTLPDVKGYNVIAEKRGSVYPEQIITVGGHLDSWDLAEGANDDGSGVVQGIEVMRTLNALGIRPKRTIRAVAFANEENGTRGAKKYAEIAKAKKEKHLFALESDGGGFTPRGFSFETGADTLSKVMKWKDLFYPYGANDFIKGGSGSDVEPLKGNGTVLAGFTSDSQRYFDIHHAATDVFENVSERELKLGAGVMAALVWLVDQYGLN